ncbi:MAG: hypothetical protein ABUK11_10180, partial [Mariprofundaceae bacterium]
KILWVVAKPEVVLTQKGVNSIVKDIKEKVPKVSDITNFTEIWFYSSVGNQPRSPSFRITDHLAVYRKEENKTFFGVAAGKLYGGWAYGPQK